MHEVEIEALRCKNELADAGLSEGCILAGEKAGVNFLKVLALFKRYGPMIVQILEQLFGDDNPPGSAPA